MKDDTIKTVGVSNEGNSKSEWVSEAGSKQEVGESACVGTIGHSPGSMLSVWLTPRNSPSCSLFTSLILSPIFHTYKILVRIYIVTFVFILTLTLSHHPHTCISPVSPHSHVHTPTLIIITNICIKSVEWELKVGCSLLLFGWRKGQSLGLWLMSYKEAVMSWRSYW